MIYLLPPALEAMRAQASADYPRECCGALLGRTREGDGGTSREVVRSVPLANAWVGAQERRYLIGGGTVLELTRQVEGEGLELLGFYHSHPDHAAIPSAFDREHAWPWYTYVIVAVRSAAVGPVRAWRLADDRSAFHEEPLAALEDP
jgi:proteasome lid subunit RPN8/RPN11